eukprot:TRINITY_DN23034_c0_g1_i1.p1 TRINITY_DN23034_c0_g1~~TRINITY_DN23034_c0_g1_i1.p1  ORF type:complete len:1316 (+),score=201.97 TRINITY_DN23034_c0_g1_i1:100-4047(+)
MADPEPPVDADEDEIGDFEFDHRHMRIEQIDLPCTPLPTNIETEAAADRSLAEKRSAPSSSLIPPFARLAPGTPLSAVIPPTPFLKERFKTLVRQTVMLEQRLEASRMSQESAQQTLEEERLRTASDRDKMRMLEARLEEIESSERNNTRKLQDLERQRRYSRESSRSSVIGVRSDCCSSRSGRSCRLSYSVRRNRRRRRRGRATRTDGSDRSYSRGLSRSKARRRRRGSRRQGYRRRGRRRARKRAGSYESSNDRCGSHGSHGSRNNGGWSSTSRSGCRSMPPGNHRRCRRRRRRDWDYDRHYRWHSRSSSSSYTSDSRGSSSGFTGECRCRQGRGRRRHSRRRGYNNHPRRRTQVHSCSTPPHFPPVNADTGLVPPVLSEADAVSAKPAGDSCTAGHSTQEGEQKRDDENKSCGVAAEDTCVGSEVIGANPVVCNSEFSVNKSHSITKDIVDRDEAHGSSIVACVGVERGSVDGDSNPALGIDGTRSGGVNDNDRDELSSVTVERNLANAAGVTSDACNPKLVTQDKVIEGHCGDAACKDARGPTLNAAAAASFAASAGTHDVTAYTGVDGACAKISASGSKVRGGSCGRAHRQRSKSINQDEAVATARGVARAAIDNTTKPICTKPTLGEDGQYPGVDSARASDKSSATLQMASVVVGDSCASSTGSGIGRDSCSAALVAGTPQRSHRRANDAHEDAGGLHGSGAASALGTPAKNTSVSNTELAVAKPNVATPCRTPGGDADCPTRITSLPTIQRMLSAAATAAFAVTMDARTGVRNGSEDGNAGNHMMQAAISAAFGTSRTTADTGPKAIETNSTPCIEGVRPDKSNGLDACNGVDEACGADASFPKSVPALCRGRVVRSATASGIPASRSRKALGNRGKPGRALGSSANAGGTNIDNSPCPSTENINPGTDVADNGRRRRLHIGSSSRVVGRTSARPIEGGSKANGGTHNRGEGDASVSCDVRGNPHPSAPADDLCVISSSSSESSSAGEFSGFHDDGSDNISTDSRAMTRSRTRAKKHSEVERDNTDGRRRGRGVRGRGGHCGRTGDSERGGRQSGKSTSGSHPGDRGNSSTPAISPIAPPVALAPPPAPEITPAPPPVMSEAFFKQPCPRKAISPELALALKQVAKVELANAAKASSPASAAARTGEVAPLQVAALALQMAGEPAPAAPPPRVSSPMAAAEAAQGTMPRPTGPSGSLHPPPTTSREQSLPTVAFAVVNAAVKAAAVCGRRQVTARKQAVPDILPAKRRRSRSDSKGQGEVPAQELGNKAIERWNRQRTGEDLRKASALAIAKWGQKFRKAKPSRRAKR